MSKEIKRTIVTSSNVIGLPEHNFGKHESLFSNVKQRAKYAELIYRGWRSDQPVRVVKVTEDVATKIVKFLTTIWEVLSKLTEESEYITDSDEEGKPIKTKLTPSELQAGFAATYMHGNKIRVPEFEVVYAFQRTSALWESNAIRIKNGGKILDVPVIVMDYTGDEGQRVKDCAMENFGKEAGMDKRVLGNHQTHIKMALEYCKFSKAVPTQKLVGELISGGVNPPKVGATQDIWPLMSLSLRFPDLGLMEKAMDATPIVDSKGKETGITKGEAWIVATTCGGDKRKAMRDLDNGTKVDAKKEDVKTVEDIKAYVSNPGVAGGNKVMSKAAILALIGVCANQKVNYVLKGILGMVPFTHETFLACNQHDNEDMKTLGLLPKEAEIRESVTTGVTA